MKKLTRKYQIIWQPSGPTVAIRDEVYQHIPSVYEAERVFLAVVIRRRQALFLLDFVQDTLLAIHTGERRTDVTDVMRLVLRAAKFKALEKLFVSMEAALYDAGERGHAAIASPEEFCRVMSL